jgi:hypothetical protein
MKIEIPNISLNAIPSYGNVAKVPEPKSHLVDQFEWPEVVTKTEKLDDFVNRITNITTALLIAKDPNGPGFIYKSIDRETGEVTRIWPRKELTSLNFEGNTQGTVFDTSA